MSASSLHNASACTAVQTFFDALLESTGLKDTLRNGGGNYTILAPHNSAWSQALVQNTLDCTTDFYITSECNNIQDLLTATNLKDILLSHSEATLAHASTDCYKVAACDARGCARWGEQVLDSLMPVTDIKPSPCSCPWAARYRSPGIFCAAAAHEWRGAACHGNPRRHLDCGASQGGSTKPACH